MLSSLKYWTLKLMDHVSIVRIKEITFNSAEFAKDYAELLDNGEIFYASMSGSLVAVPNGYIQTNRVIQLPESCKEPYDNGILKGSCAAWARRSIVFAEALDNNFDKTQFSYKNDNYPQIVPVVAPKVNPFEGPEDARVILDAYGNVMLSFTMKDEDGTHLIWNYNVTSKTLKKLVPSFEHSAWQKNWIPILNRTNDLNYIYSWDPVLTLDCFGERCEKLQNDTGKITMFRGGSAMVKYRNYYVGMTRVTTGCPGKGNIYRPRFSMLNANLEIIYVSERIDFDGKLFIEPFFPFATIKDIPGVHHTAIMTVAGFTKGFNGNWAIEFSVNDQKNFVVELQGLDRFLDAIIYMYELYSSGSSIPNLLSLAIEKNVDVCNFWN
ncbi:hypothetical protein HDV01_003702 [Terramyces sp. JEL0728]|nr:hypothetical protein HDV01_003702 [Terramyces sp. JEL0728]